MQAILSASNLTKTYRKGRNTIEALKGITLEVKQGEIFALVGPNGAGKTTFIKLALGLRTPTKGTILLYGKPLSQPRTRRHIGYQPEHFPMPGHLKVEAILHFYGMLSGLRGTILRQRIEETLEEVALTEHRNTSFRALSKGMRQRLALAQALLHEPDFLILDEPTSGLDPIARNHFRLLIQRLNHTGKTILMNTHLLDEVARLAHRIAIFNQGQLLAVDTPEALLSTGGDELEAAIVNMIQSHD